MASFNLLQPLSLLCLLFSFLLLLDFTSFSSAQECSVRPQTSVVENILTWPYEYHFLSRLEEFLNEYNGQLNSTSEQTFNLSTIAVAHRAELARLQRRWLPIYYRVDPDQVDFRVDIMQRVLQLIEPHRETLKRAMERFETYRTQPETFRNNDAVDSAMVKEKTELIASQLKEARNKGLPTNESDPISWSIKLESVWNQFRCNSTKREELRANLQGVKRPLAGWKAEVESLLDPVPRDMSKYFAPSTEAAILESLSTLTWAQRFADEYLDLMTNGQRPFPVGGNCSAPRLVPGALDIQKQVELEKKNLLHWYLSPEEVTFFLYLYRTRRDEPLKVAQFIQNIYLPKLNEIQTQLEESLSVVEAENFHDKFQLGVSQDYLQALMQYERNFVNRSEFYNNQSEEYFGWSHNPDMVPIEQGLEEIDDRFEQMALKRSGGCLLWTEQIETQIKNKENSKLTETFELFKANALEAKAKLEKLWQILPSDHSRYLRPETEIELIRHDKFYSRMVALCDEYLQRVKA